MSLIESMREKISEREEQLKKAGLLLFEMEQVELRLIRFRKALETYVRDDIRSLKIVYLSPSPQDDGVMIDSALCLSPTAVDKALETEISLLMKREEELNAEFQAL